jgi:hypothetical protein
LQKSNQIDIAGHNAIKKAKPVWTIAPGGNHRYLGDMLVRLVRVHFSGAQIDGAVRCIQ